MSPQPSRSSGAGTRFDPPQGDVDFEAHDDGATGSEGSGRLVGVGNDPPPEANPLMRPDSGRASLQTWTWAVLIVAALVAAAWIVMWSLYRPDQHVPQGAPGAGASRTRTVAVNAGIPEDAGGSLRHVALRV